MRVLLVHALPLTRLGGAELHLRAYRRSAPAGIKLHVCLPDDPVVLDEFDTVILCNLRPEGGLGEAEEYRWAVEWAERIKGFRGHVLRLEFDAHPCTYRDARCIDFDTLKNSGCSCNSPIPGAFRNLYNLCDDILFLSPLHREAMNQIIDIRVRRQHVIAVPVDFERFRSRVPFDQRRAAALVTGDAVRVGPDAETLAEQAGYPIEILPYLSIPHKEMPALLNSYQAVIVAPEMIHAFGQLAVEAMACGCQVLTNNRVGAMSFPDPLLAARRSERVFWNIVQQRPAQPNPERVSDQPR